MKESTSRTEDEDRPGEFITTTTGSAVAYFVNVYDTEVLENPVILGKNSKYYPDARLFNQAKALSFSIAILTSWLVI
jgi:hypothetical protein